MYSAPASSWYSFANALQLTIALDLRHIGEIGVLAAADQRLCRVASVAGCVAVNVEKPGSVLG